MTERHSFLKDVTRDATIVEAKMADRPVYLLASGLGMTPDEIFVRHPKWLARQSQDYREQVVEAVIALQDKILAGGSK